jgi:hypothetical protein
MARFHRSLEVGAFAFMRLGLGHRTLAVLRKT